MGKVSLDVEMLASLIEEGKPKQVRTRPVGIADMTEDELRCYKRNKQAERRKALKERKAAGSVKFHADSARDALADAAMVILALGGEGAAEIMAYLRHVYHDQPGAPMTIQARVKTGKLKPRLMQVALKSVKSA